MHFVVSGNMPYSDVPIEIDDAAVRAAIDSGEAVDEADAAHYLLLIAEDTDACESFGRAFWGHVADYAGYPLYDADVSVAG